eukprot:scaffold4562_cov255-Pinguiococcus_pyrenoidosus.AAC.20
MVPALSVVLGARVEGVQPQLEGRNCIAIVQQSSGRFRPGALLLDTAGDGVALQRKRIVTEDRANHTKQLHRAQKHQPFTRPVGFLRGREEDPAHRRQVMKPINAQRRFKAQRAHDVEKPPKTNDGHASDDATSLVHVVDAAGLDEVAAGIMHVIPHPKIGLPARPLHEIVCHNVTFIRA